MSEWYSRPDFRNLEIVMEHITATRWGWREPHGIELRSDASGNVLIATRDECNRTRCLASRLDEKRSYVWSVWAVESRESKTAEWQELRREPRFTRIRLNASERWEINNLPIDARSNEWKYLAPDELRSMLMPSRGTAAELAEP